jgi:Phosphate-selective porin O and P
MKKAILFLVFVAFYQIGLAQKDSTQKIKKYLPTITGVIAVHYLNELNTNGDGSHDPDGFRIFRARFTAKGRINKYTTYQMQVDVRSPEHSGLLRDAFIDFEVLKNQTIRVGQQKTRFGYENLVSATELYTINRSNLTDYLARGYTLREAGIGLIGKVKLNKSLDFEDDFTFTNGSKMNVTGPQDFSATKNAWGRIGLRYQNKKNMYRIGISGGTGGITEYSDPGTADDIFFKIKRIGIDMEIETKYLNIYGEFAAGTNTYKDTGEIEDINGFYLILLGKTKWNIGPFIRYEATTEDDFVKTTAGLYYGKPKAKLRFIMNYEFRGQFKDVPQGHDDRLYLQCQIAF